MKVLYRIETQDGIVVRAKATRPYVAGFVVRDVLGNVADKGYHHDFTIRPKHSYGFTRHWNGTTDKAVYEKLVAKPINARP